MDAEERTSLLVDYVNDRLDDSQRKTVEALLKGDPEARAEYEILTMVVDSLVQIPPDVAQDHGFDELMTRIRADDFDKPTAAKPSNLRKEPSRNTGPGFWSNAICWLLRPSLSYAVAASIFAVQFAVLAVLYRTPTDQADYSAVRTRPTVPPVAGPFIRVSFKPDAKESDIRFLLISVGAIIVGGPTQLGDYYLYVQPERADWAAQKIGKSPIVDQANVMATLPPLKD